MRKQFVNVLTKICASSGVYDFHSALARQLSWPERPARQLANTLIPLSWLHLVWGHISVTTHTSFWELVFTLPPSCLGPLPAHVRWMTVRTCSVWCVILVTKGLEVAHLSLRSAVWAMARPPLLQELNGFDLPSGLYEENVSLNCEAQLRWSAIRRRTSGMCSVNSLTLIFLLFPVSGYACT